ncbi:MAG: SUMF1/EgtB/PvdO family nonheme iron enzyme [Chloroflexi bacterium]|nr:SUMF1/EgtB/PvdO family nonheme iron enzyme [Chloroflexota bacterium]
MPLLPGETLNKRYRIVHLLAEGSYGAVYRARDTIAEQDVAIKEYLDSSDEIRKLFRQEARKLSRMEHPQLPKVLDHFSLDGVGQYLVSAYVDGVDLQNLQERYGRLPTDLIINWLTAVSTPLTYLHEQDQLHLNLKPANIRITPAGDVILVNIGLPGLGTRPRASGYGSPEQQAQLDVSPASDIYSLGATLYTLLTGSVPPNALSRESGLSELTPARDVNPDVEPYLSLAAGRAMSIRTDTRYESIANFAKALTRPYGPQATLSDEPRRTVARQTAVPVPPRLPPRTRKQIEQRTIYGLLGLLIFVIIIGTSAIRINQPEEIEITDVEATATFVSAVVEAATALAPTPSPTPVPTIPPTPSPEPFISSTGSRMIFVPDGIFRMGTEEGETDEGPSHLIRLSAFFIDETEVTNAEYALCVDEGICTAPARLTATYHPAYYGAAAYDNYPIIFVNWFDANTFCEWRGARLPSEAEWEKAAAYDPNQAIILRYPWGDAFDGVKVNYCDANCTNAKRDAGFDDGHQDTAPVGSYPDGRSPIGIYDMAGNVMEWVSDWYDQRYYASSTDTNPLGPPEGNFKALRGGSWLSSQDELAVYIRSSFDPTVARANLGFRCAMDSN